MQPVHIIAIIVRLFAVGLFLISIEGVAALFLLTIESKLLYYYLAHIVGAISAVFLWVFPTVVSRKIYPIKTKKLSHTKLTYSDFYHLGFVILGAYLLFNVFSDIAYWVSFMALANKDVSLGFGDLSVEHLSSIITTVFELILAAIFILHGKLHPRSIFSAIRTHKIK